MPSISKLRFLLCSIAVGAFAVEPSATLFENGDVKVARALEKGHHAPRLLLTTDAMAGAAEELTDEQALAKAKELRAAIAQLDEQERETLFKAGDIIKRVLDKDQP